MKEKEETLVKNTLINKSVIWDGKIPGIMLRSVFIELSQRVPDLTMDKMVDIGRTAGVVGDVSGGQSSEKTDPPKEETNPGADKPPEKKRRGELKKFVVEKINLEAKNLTDEIDRLFEMSNKAGFATSRPYLVKTIREVREAGKKPAQKKTPKESLRDFVRSNFNPAAEIIASEVKRLLRLATEAGFKTTEGSVAQTVRDVRKELATPPPVPQKREEKVEPQPKPASLAESIVSVAEKVSALEKENKQFEVILSETVSLLKEAAARIEKYLSRS